MPLMLKTEEVNGKTYALVQDGKPLFVDETGKDIPFDADHSVATIKRLNGEAQGHREAKEKAEGDLKKFEGITDPAAALKALETVTNLDQGQLVTAGKVEEIKKAAKEAAEKQVEAATKGLKEEITGLTGKLAKSEGAFFAEKVGGAFARSKFIADKIAVPADMMQSMFGSRFKIEDGKIVGLDGAGQPIYSRTKNGDVAEFEEAIESMVDAYPNKDSILKGTGSSGSGKKPGEGGMGGGKTLTRAEFDRLDPTARAAKMKDGYKLVD